MYLKLIMNTLSLKIDLVHISLTSVALKYNVILNLRKNKTIIDEVYCTFLITPSCFFIKYNFLFSR
jgi:hypothetical protein